MVDYLITSNGTYEGTKFEDTFTIGDGVTNVTIKARFGLDLIYGTAGAESITIKAGDPNDELTRDYVHAGAGDDYILVQTVNIDRGLATVYAGDGNDRVIGAQEAHGGDGNDHITDALIAFGGAGDDRIDSGIETREAHGGDGNDTIYMVLKAYGDAGNDTIYGANRSFTELFGGEGDDIIFALSGNDILMGGDGADRLQGGGGNDLLDGGLDDDIDFLWGSGGADTFVIHAGDARTRIGDFTAADGDIIRLDGYTLDDLHEATITSINNGGAKSLVTFADGTEVPITSWIPGEQPIDSWFEFV